MWVGAKRRKIAPQIESFTATPATIGGGRVDCGVDDDEPDEIAMSSLPDFLFKILRQTSRPEEGRGKMIIIIRRPYAYLEPELRAAFEGQEDVQVIVDRRTRDEPVEVERRQRRPKEEILEVVILG